MKFNSKFRVFSADIQVHIWRAKIKWIFFYWKDEITSCNKDQVNWGNKSNKCISTSQDTQHRAELHQQATIL